MNVISGRTGRSRHQSAQIPPLQISAPHNSATSQTDYRITRHVRSEPTSPVRHLGTPVRIGRAQTLSRGESLTDGRPPSPNLANYSSTSRQEFQYPLVGRKNPIKIMPPGRSPSPNRSRSTWRQQSPTKQLDQQVSSIMNLPDKGYQGQGPWNQGRQTPVKVHTHTTRSPSPSSNKSVWRQHSSTQVLDEQVALITKELEALANNMDKIIFTPVDVTSSRASYTPENELQSPPRILSPPSGKHFSLSALSGGTFQKSFVQKCFLKL